MFGNLCFAVSVMEAELVCIYQTFECEVKCRKSYIHQRLYPFNVHPAVPTD